ncbi:hypothetical protein SCD_n02276 [Sulfuricella denitrificans skB26]|uniref:Uncharacterized protein n=1 Tax=Sulfuricella denitrificans (strain DSM 22764 / NBRC 105220 / skB26) TaxID=1163617 RepID=S6AMP3_SULDS|nr:hypothetical protein [Sulfuricella denitrificans]BAN36084.1 hypothetical protein SCD_n02276 [Sulfuricella denitrificans skB26]
MIDLKPAAAIAKRFILPTLLALIILGIPLGYQYYKLHKERGSLTALQADLEKKKTELAAKSASREAEQAEKVKALGVKEAELISMASQLKKSMIFLNKRENEYQDALVKFQQEQALAHQKAKQRPLKRAEIQPPKRAPLKRDVKVSPKKRPSLGTAPKKLVEAKEMLPAMVSPPPIAPPPVVKLEESLPQARPPGACASADGRTDATREMARLKRKISATSFKINYRPVALTPNIRSGFPEDLLRRLGESDEFLPRNVSLGTGYPPLNAQSGSLSSTDAARDVAFKTGSQFVLSGVIDAGIGRTDYGRWVEVEVDAYDGLTGVLVAKRRQGMEIAGENEIEIRSLFGSTQYFSTPFGKRFDELMKSLVKGIRTDLACMPFTAQITGIDLDNNKIHIDGGTSSRVAPGDKFIAYRSARRIQSESASGGVLGAQTIPVASLTIRQVFPLFSIGELSVDPRKTELHVGDFVSAQKTHIGK